MESLDVTDVAHTHRQFNQRNDDDNQGAYVLLLIDTHSHPFLGHIVESVSDAKAYISSAVKRTLPVPNTGRIACKCMDSTSLSNLQ